MHTQFPSLLFWWCVEFLFAGARPVFSRLRGCIPWDRSQFARNCRLHFFRDPQFPCPPAQKMFLSAFPSITELRLFFVQRCFHLIIARFLRPNFWPKIFGPGRGLYFSESLSRQDISLRSSCINKVNWVKAAFGPSGSLSASTFQ